MKAFGLATTLGLGPISAIAAAVGLLVFALIKVNKISKEYQTAQQNMNNAMSGAATSVEEYDAGLTAAEASLDLLKIKQEQNMATLKTMRGVTQANIDVQISQDKIAIEARESEMRLMTKNKDLYINSQEQKAEAENKRAQQEMQNQLDIAAGVAQENSDKLTAIALSEQQAASLKAIRKELEESQMTAEERYDAEIEKLKELGLTTAEITAYMKLAFSDLAEAQDEGVESATTGMRNLKSEMQMLNGEGVVPMTKASANMWQKFGEGAAAGTEKVKTVLQELNDFVTGELFVTLYDGISALATSGLDLFNQIMDNQITAIEDKYAIQTSEEIAYQAFLDGEKAKDKQADKEELTALKLKLKTETDLEKKAELEKQIAMLETSIKDQQLSEDAATSRVAAEEAAEAEILAIKRKTFIADKALRITMAIIDTASAVIAALTIPGPAGIAMSVAAGIIGALSVAKIATEPMPMVRGGGVDIENSGVFSGQPGIDTNNVALTSGEYVMPVQQTRDNYETLEAMRSGQSGNAITITPAPVELFLDSEKIGEGMIEFMTAESDLGTFRINPKVLSEA